MRGAARCTGGRRDLEPATASLSLRSLPPDSTTREPPLPPEPRMHATPPELAHLPPDARREIEEVVRTLSLAPHPEGGFYRETWRSEQRSDGRSLGTAIHFLLPEGVANRWHRVDAVEIWHHYAGGPLELRLSEDGRTVRTTILGDRPSKGEAPQVIIPAGAWQAARATDRWTLCGCTVVPAFEFRTFEMKPAGWEPG